MFKLTVTALTFKEGANNSGFACIGVPMLRTHLKYFCRISKTVLAIFIHLNTSWY